MRAERLLDGLRTCRKVDAWSIYVQETRRLSLGVKDREVGNPHAPLRLSESCSARYLIVWDDGKVSRGAFERRRLDEDPSRALADARAAAYDDPDAAHVLGPATFPEVELYDETAATMARGDTAWIAERLPEVGERAEHPDVRTWSASFAAAEGSARLVTSAGLDAATSGTSVSWWVAIDGEAGDGFGSRAAEPHDAFLARLDRLMGVAAALRTPAEPMNGGLHDVILHPRVVESYALQTLLGNLSGHTVAHGESHFRREQFGSTAAVLREDLVLRIDPLRPLKSGSYRFTSEGVPAARCSFIDAGRLVQPILDVKYARRLGLAPTPQPQDMDTLILEGPPRLSFEQALRVAADGALVLSVLGVHTQDAASGDFSLAAPQTLRLAAAGFRGRLRATLSGNLFDLLRGDDLQLVDFDGETTPGLLVRCRLDPQ